jgi:hypothetical protein
MATSLTRDATNDESPEPREIDAGVRWGRAEVLWTVFGLVLLVTFLFLVAEDYPLRNLIAVR